MDFKFNKPSLELEVLIHKAKKKDINSIEKLRSFLVSNCMYSVYRSLVDKEILQHNKQDLRQILSDKEKIINELIDLKDKDPENSTYIHSINIKIAEYYASSMDVKECLDLMRDLTLDESSLSIQMDIYLCQVRLAILTKDKKLLEKSIEKANDVAVRGCDWDRLNKFKIYKGLYALMKGKFNETAVLLSESLPSFEKNEALEYEKAVQYLIFSGLLTYERSEIRTKLLECSEVLAVGTKVSIDLVRSLYDCNYYDFLPFLYKFLLSVKDDVYLSHFIDFFCKEMKLIAYKQLLNSYQSLSLKNMAGLFGVEETYLEKDLEVYIVEDRMHCKIDKISGTIVIEEVEDNTVEKIIEKGNNLIRLIKKHVK